MLKDDRDERRLQLGLGIFSWVTLEEIFEQKCLAENFRVKFFLPKIFGRKFLAEYFWPKIFGRKFLAENFWPNILLAANSFGRKLGDPKL